MSRFYIKQISATGAGVEPSTIPFQDGVNIIYGASNSGKSYVINCINFMFYGEIPFNKDATGYDTVSMIMESDDGYSIQMTRKIVDGAKGETGEGKVAVVSNVPGIDSRDYTNKAEYSAVLLKLFGIMERHDYISLQDFKTNHFSVRSFFHMFYIDEDNIFSKKSSLVSPKNTRIYGSFAALWLLLTGDDLQWLLPDETKDELDRKATQKKGVIIYLNRKIVELTERRKVLEQDIAEVGDVDIEAKINDIVTEIEAVEKQIREATAESQQLLQRIYSVSSKLEEAKFLKSRYTSLRSQYVSDIKRLRFITDGEKKGAQHTLPVFCPFCETDISDKQKGQESYVEASQAELGRINLQMQDLEAANNDVSREINALQNEMSTLNARNGEISIIINQQYKPRASELRAMVESYKRVLLYQQEMYALDAMSTELNTDVFNKENEEDSEAPKFNPRKFFTEDGTWAALSEDFGTMVSNCAYPGHPVSRIDIDTMDAVVGGKFKKNQGKGYRAFLNTIMLFNLMKYFEKNATYAPRMLILDSPILSLKEKKIQISEKEKATPGMRESLFDYIVKNCGENQVIIAENEIPSNVDYSTANMIEFTLEEGVGRYGFLRSFH
ncbi:MAG: AAA family ATPase [Lachnospiraceae bacterium]